MHDKNRYRNVLAIVLEAYAGLMPSPHRIDENHRRGDLYRETPFREQLHREAFGGRKKKLYDRSMRRLRPHYLLFLQDSLAISFTHRSFSASFGFFSKGVSKVGRNLGPSYPQKMFKNSAHKTPRPFVKNLTARHPLVSPKKSRQHSFFFRSSVFRVWTAG